MSDSRNAPAPSEIGTMLLHRYRSLHILALVVMPAVMALCPRAVNAQTEQNLVQDMIGPAAEGLSAPSAVVAIVTSTGELLEYAWGEAAPGVSASPETAYQIGSITKTFVGALTALMAAEGTVDLDASIDAFELPSSVPRNATPRTLLNHTSGMPDVWDDPSFIPSVMMNPTRVWTPSEHLDRLPAHSPDGEATWDYSSSGYVALGLVLEQAGGEPLPEMIHRRLLAPLGLTATYWGGFDEIGATTAHGWVDINQDGTPEDLSAMIPFTSFFSVAGAGGAMVSTAGDLARWMSELMTSPQFPGAVRDEMTQWVERPDGHHHGGGLLRMVGAHGPMIGHRGNSAGFSGEVWYLPEVGTTIAVLTNVNATIVTPITDAVLAAIVTH